MITLCTRQLGCLELFVTAFGDVDLALCGDRGSITVRKSSHSNLVLLHRDPTCFRLKTSCSNRLNI